MRKISILLVAAVVVGAVLVAGASARRSATPVLTGTVGPGFTISIKKGGKTVKTLKAGTYKLVIHDKASIHGFSLDGPHGFAKDISPVPFVGTKTITLKLKAGGYKFYCPPHEPTMFGRFTVK
jgi:outer membrane murein-binding lipoprotein Lpp